MIFKRRSTPCRLAGELTICSNGCRNLEQMSISQYSSVYANRFSSPDRLLSALFCSFTNRSLFSLLTISIGTPKLIRPRLMEICIVHERQHSHLQTTHRQHIALARKASKARFSAGRRRPPAVWHDRQGIADVILSVRILWRQF